MERAGDKHGQDQKSDFRAQSCPALGEEVTHVSTLPSLSRPAVVIALFLLQGQVGSGGRRKRREKEGGTAPAAGGPRGSHPIFPISKALLITGMAFSIVDASYRPRALSYSAPTSLLPLPLPLRTTTATPLPVLHPSSRP
ncbi:hypothetical protein CORC01_08810 [Colletotrichum orchidophilum]|uniref:Uncharacterized protein n=1 Tax=Colletotrichum orchidophilum TaxID=1209926 RepID=A0A1G4B3F4_9PEZI|nr:uncharacterized protein CORC01_08810 [Colletotrichum orchidophilum]OHE95958.1 hypothetical protein CORC01_08810 [Colletotrichum orchidophilum]